VRADRKGEKMSKITNVKESRAAIGKRVYWNDKPSARYEGFEREGTLTEVSGKNLLIGGDWKWRTNLFNLRTTKECGQVIKTKGD
jgi:hypothetical protein